jgi:6-pyruvoyltetrahydropterin/6-carboxytetrahydropterin synthase
VYATGTALQVPAFHVLPGMPPRAGQRHSHDYRLDVVVRRDGLDARGMVVDLDLPDRALRDDAARVDGADLETVVPAEVMTFGVFARRAQARLTAALGRLPGASPAFRIRESPVAFGGFPSAW